MNKTRCNICNLPMDNGHCYNIECSNYDPIAQYFEGPTTEELAADAAAIEKRLQNITVETNDEAPF